MSNLPMPTLQNLLAKEGAAFSLPSPTPGPSNLREQPGGGLRPDSGQASDTDSDETSSGRTRTRIAKGAMPSISPSSSEDECSPTSTSTSNSSAALIKQRSAPVLDSGAAKLSSPSLQPRPDSGLLPQPPAGRPIKVIVVADVVCPWCYVALRSIQLALQDLTLSCLSSFSSSSPSTSQLQHPRFDIEFRPFFINDNFGSDEIAIDRRAFLESKFGAKLEEHDRIVRERGKTLGIDFKFGGMLRQTTRAHRLLTLAYRTGGSSLQLALLEHLFHATHVEEQDIGNVDLLAYYADKVGLLPKQTAQRWLRTHDLETDVRRLVKISVQGCGIAGVPFVVVDGKWAIGGGEERNIYYRVFEKVWKGNMQ